MKNSPSKTPRFITFALILSSFLSLNSFAARPVSPPVRVFYSHDMNPQFYNQITQQIIQRLDSLFTQNFYDGVNPIGEACRLTVVRNRTLTSIPLGPVTLWPNYLPGIYLYGFEAYPGSWMGPYNRNVLTQLSASFQVTPSTWQQFTELNETREALDLETHVFPGWYGNIHFGVQWFHSLHVDKSSTGEITRVVIQESSFYPLTQSTQSRVFICGK